MLTRRPLQIYLGPEVGGHVGIPEIPRPRQDPRILSDLVDKVLRVGIAGLGIGQKNGFIRAVAQDP